MDWMDFDRDGEVDAAEEFFGAEMLCSSKEEHEALFGDAGDFDADEADDSYDDGYEDVYNDGDYDDDRYWDDDSYADGVDDALDEWDEYGEGW